MYALKKINEIISKEQKSFLTDVWHLIFLTDLLITIWNYYYAK